MGELSFGAGRGVAPGAALRLVIVDRLPFDVPSDPLVEARTRKLGEAGQDPFMEYLVPSAALALKQGFGRLIRSRQDRGVVAEAEVARPRMADGHLAADSRQVALFAVQRLGGPARAGRDDARRSVFIQPPAAVRA